MVASPRTELEGPPSTTEDSRKLRILLLVAYDGSALAGFQQQDNAETVAGNLDRAIRSIDPEASRVLGSSRTDAGVHARLQPVTFDTRRRSPTPRGWVLALAAELPESIAVLRASEVPSDFDPRRKPLWKIYRYRVLCSPVNDPFLARQAFRVRDQLDLELMQKEANSMVGEHDFAAFRSSKDPRTHTIRHLHAVDVVPSRGDPRCVDIIVRGDRFLYNMVRIIAGSLVDVARGKLAPGAAARAILSGERSDLGMTAPAHGLCLEHVELPDWGRDAWPAGTPEIPHFF
jgi:tRNA pseudouridine38-40 synthase